MKINRLLEITVLLLNRKSMRARDLADRFEVSTRTIYRDVEALSMAGIPVYMSKGKGGGISLLEDFSVDKTMLSKEDKEGLLVALKTLQATKFPEVDSAIEKISTLFKEVVPEDWVLVDFSNWGSNPNENKKFMIIKEAILKRRILSFNYINTQGYKSIRSVEPIKLLYKGQGWYLYGYCKLKEAFRIFRLSRIKELSLENGTFMRKSVNIDNLKEIGYIGSPSSIVTLKLRFKPHMLHRVYDDFDEENIQRNSDDTCDVTISFPEDEWVYGYILSFGASVEVIEPKEIRNIVLQRLMEAICIYKGQEGLGD